MFVLCCMLLAEKGRDLVDFKLIQEPGVMALVKSFFARGNGGCLIK